MGDGRHTNQILHRILDWQFLDICLASAGQSISRVKLFFDLRLTLYRLTKSTEIPLDLAKRNLSWLLDLTHFCQSRP